MKNIVDRTMDRRKNDNATAALEDTMAAFIGAGDAVFVNSGEAATRLALQLAAEEVYGIPLSARSGMKESMANDIAGGRDAHCLGNRRRSSIIGKGGGDEQDAFAVGKRESAAIGLGQESISIGLELAERRDGSMRPVGSLQGRRVFCPDLAPASLARAILCEGGRPVFIDISPCDWCMDPEALEIAFGLYPDVRIVLMTHLYGFPGQIREIKEICVRHGAVLIEDASDALGASIGGRMAGSFGDYGILDFGKGKIVSADAGGMLLLNRGFGAVGADVGNAIGTGATGRFEPNGDADVACAIAGAGYDNEIDAVACASFRPENSSASTAKRERWRMDLPDPVLPRARHGRISHSHARTGSHTVAESLAKRILSELPHLSERIARKKEIYENYREMLDGDLMYMNPVGAGTEPNYWMPCITCESAIPFQESRFEGGYSYANPHGTSSPMEIHDALRACGIWSRPVYSPLHLQPAFRGCGRVSLDGSRIVAHIGDVPQWNKEESALENIGNAQKADGVTNMAHGIRTILWPSGKKSDMKALDLAPASAIPWERCDWSKQISSTGLCLPSDPGMTWAEQERVAGIIYACFDAGEAGGFWKTA